MSIVLSLITAVTFGIGDFFGGLSAKRVSAVQVVAGSHSLGLVGVLIASMLIDNTFIANDFFLGVIAGAFGAIGVGLLYRGLSRGPMAVVAPITAVTSAAVPASWGVITGERLSTLVWVGVALAFVAIWLVSSTDRDASDEVSPKVIIEALLAGAGFGMFFIVLDETNTISAPWPIVGARLFSATLLVAWLVLRRLPMLPPTPSGRGLIALTGLFDTGSNVLFLYALRAGDLTTVAVLTALYPIPTVVLARIVLQERMTMNQLLGFVSALGATVLIAAG